MSDSFNCGCILCFAIETQFNISKIWVRHHIINTISSFKSTVSFRGKSAKNKNKKIKQFLILAPAEVLFCCFFVFLIVSLACLAYWKPNVVVFAYVYRHGNELWPPTFGLLKNNFANAKEKGFWICTFYKKEFARPENLLNAFFCWFIFHFYQNIRIIIIVNTNECYCQNWWIPNVKQWIQNRNKMEINSRLL